MSRRVEGAEMQLGSKPTLQRGSPEMEEMPQVQRSEGIKPIRHP